MILLDGVRPGQSVVSLVPIYAATSDLHDVTSSDRRPRSTDLERAPADIPECQSTISW